MGCGFLTGAGAVFRSMKVRRGSKIAVFGTGAVGMAAIAAAKVLDCSQIVAIDIAPSRLEVAREFGATDVLDGHDPELARKLVSITGAGADYTFDTTGVPSVMGVAIDCLAILGTFGHCAARDNASFSPLSMMRGNTIRGVVEGDSDPQLHVPELLDSLSIAWSGTIRLRRSMRLSKTQFAAMSSSPSSCSIDMEPRE